MTQEAGRSDVLIADYVESGWHVLDPEKRRPDIDFVPDFLLHKGDDFLVVEVKRQGGDARVAASIRPIAEMRRIVERQPNWHFTVKLLPSPSFGSAVEPGAEDLQDRLRVAGILLEGGHSDEAILIASSVIETSLRRLVADDAGTSVEQDLPALLRSAYEAELVSDPELRRIEHARSLRNDIAHGFKVSASPDDAKRILDLAMGLFERANILAATAVPADVSP